MHVLLDLTGDRNVHAFQPVRAEVLCMAVHQGKTLFAVHAVIDGGDWFGLIHENSTALIQAPYYAP